MSSDPMRNTVKRHYAEIALHSTPCCAQSCGCGGSTTLDTVQFVHRRVDTPSDHRILDVAELGLSCGTPLDIAKIGKGMSVLDLGSGAGIDVFLASKDVGADGLVIGLDFTPEMIERARQNANRLEITNVEFRLGEIESMPVDTGSVDRIISNCVINLVADKGAAFREMFRVMRAGGMFVLSDIVSDLPMPTDVAERGELWASCIAGAIPKSEYLRLLAASGFEDVEVVTEKPYPTAEELGVKLLSVSVRGTKR